MSIWSEMYKYNVKNKRLIKNGNASESMEFNLSPTTEFKHFLTLYPKLSGEVNIRIFPNFVGSGTSTTGTIEVRNENEQVVASVVIRTGNEQPFALSVNFGKPYKFYYKTDSDGYAPVPQKVTCSYGVSEEKFISLEGVE